MVDVRIQRIREMIEPLAESMGLSLWGIETPTTTRGIVLRIYVDAAQGVSIEQCKTLSKHLGLIFDVEDPLPGGAYTLEVSSPGLERPFFEIRQLRPYLGQKIAVKCRQAVHGSKTWRGTLQAVEDQSFTIQTETTPVSFAWDQCSRIHLLYEGPVPSGKSKNKQDG